MTTKRLVPVTVIVPIFDEANGIPQLADALVRVRKALVADYAVRFILVDDGSSDGTARLLLSTFASWNHCDIVQHPRNRGIAAAIRTGLKAARTEIVCSIDADCTYDPDQLAAMIPLLTEGVDLVTASPYHPKGEVRNVPGWRLTLSKCASFLYRRVTGRQLHTFTSCFRVYRRSAVVSLPVRRDGFHGVAELLAMLALKDGRIVEHPAVLDVRRFGQSKMKVLRTIMGHLELLTQLALGRCLPSLARDTAAGQTPSPVPSYACQPAHLERTTA